MRSLPLLPFWVAIVLIASTLGSCTAMKSVLDYPMSFFTEDGEEVETTVGDAVANSAPGIASAIGNTLGGVNPLLGVAAGAAAAAMLGKARRKKKLAVETKK